MPGREEERQGGRGRQGEAEDTGRRSDKRKPTLRCSSSCEVFGFSVSRRGFRNNLERLLNVQVSYGTKRRTRRCYDFRSFVSLIAESLVFVRRVVKDTTRFDRVARHHGYRIATASLYAYARKAIRLVRYLGERNSLQSVEN